MRKTIIFVSTIFLTAIFILGCGNQVKDENVGSGDNPFVTASNEQLAKYPVSGFGYKSSRMPAAAWAKWAKVAAPIVKGILDKLPGGYALEVRGHTDSSGPEEPMGNKPGNIKISQDRAKTVHGALKGAGISSPNLVDNGVGSSEPIPGVEPRSAQQRRVTFVIVKKD